jgi:hypothetical protein
MEAVSMHLEMHLLEVCSEELPVKTASESSREQTIFFSILFRHENNKSHESVCASWVYVERQPALADSRRHALSRRRYLLSSAQ